MREVPNKRSIDDLGAMINRTPGITYCKYIGLLVGAFFLVLWGIAWGYGNALQSSSVAAVFVVGLLFTLHTFSVRILRASAQRVQPSTRELRGFLVAMYATQFYCVGLITCYLALGVFWLLA